jgi:hypothetical protein
MTSIIDLRTLPTNVPSLCIPRVFSNITEQRIRNIFDELKLGNIQRVDIIKKTTEKGEKFNRVFIHFNEWFSNTNADTARERLINGKEIKIIYDDPWFWKISAYREPSKKPYQKTDTRHQQKLHRQPKTPSIQFDTDETHKKISKQETMNTTTTIKKSAPRTPSNSPPRIRQTKKPNLTIEIDDDNLEDGEL